MTFTSQKQYHTTLSIFRAFMQRDFGMNLYQAQEEWNILTSGLHYLTKEGYWKASRIGLTFKTDRIMRSSIYSAFENAINHASFQE